MIYLLPFILSIISVFIDFFKFKKTSYFINIIITIILILIAGLRYDTGLDYWNYVEMYDSSLINKFYEIHSCEPLFGILLQLFSDLDFDYFILFLAFISITIKIWSINRFSLIPSISILIYVSKFFVVSDMGQIRQGIAMGVLLFTIPYILNRKFFKFTLIIILATLLHSTAILFIFAYFASNLKLKKTTYIAISIFSFIFIFIDTSVIISKLYFIFPNLLKEKFLFYTQFHIVDKGFYLKTILLKVPVLIGSIIFYDQLKKDKLHLLLFKLYFIGFFLSLFFITFYQLSIRGSLYYTHFEILLIPVFIHYLKPQLINFLIYLLIVFYSTFSFSRIYYSDWTRYLIPYYSIYEKEKLLYKRSTAEFE